MTKKNITITISLVVLIGAIYYIIQPYLIVFKINSCIKRNDSESLKEYINTVNISPKGFVKGMRKNSFVTENIDSKETLLDHAKLSYSSFSTFLISIPDKNMKLFLKRDGFTWKISKMTVNYNQFMLDRLETFSSKKIKYQKIGLYGHFLGNSFQQSLSRAYMFHRTYYPINKNPLDGSAIGINYITKNGIQVFLDFTDEYGITTNLLFNIKRGLVAESEFEKLIMTDSDYELLVKNTILLLKKFKIENGGALFNNTVFSFRTLISVPSKEYFTVDGYLFYDEFILGFTQHKSKRDALTFVEEFIYNKKRNKRQLISNFKWSDFEKHYKDIIER